MSRLWSFAYWRRIPGWDRWLFWWWKQTSARWDRLRFVWETWRQGRKGN